jgi:adenine C2-methylase RlmN of 23S rRNA A2503 and tRNA A37
MQNLWGMTFAEVTEELKLLELSQVNAKLLFSAMHRLNPDRLIKDKRSSPKLLTIYQEQLTLLPKIASAHVAQDQTIKLLIELCDGVQVESVLIPFRSQ